MKRFGTVLFILSIFALSARAQSTHVNMHAAPNKMLVPATFGGGLVNTPILPRSGGQPLTTQIDTVFYYGDTSAGAWVYVPVLNQASGDSLGYYGVSQNGLFYYQTEDTIGPLEYQDQNGVKHTVTDTMYSRMMGVRFNTPTDIKSPKLIGADLTLFPISLNPTDSIKFWVVPIADVPFTNGETHPIPSIFGTRIATGAVPASQITVGQVNNVHVTLNALLGVNTHLTYPQFAIMAFVDGPNFPDDTVGFVLDQNLQPFSTQLTIDTDGSLGVTGEPMRTYQLNLDDGTVLGGYIGGGGGFFVNFAELDPSNGTQTGNAYDGNLLLTAYFSGSPLAVTPSDPNAYGLSGNFPNPVGTSTAISYNLAQSGPVSLTLYNALGERVGTVVSGVQGAGAHSATFTPGTLPNGMYYYKLQSGDFSATRQMVISR